MPPAGAIHGVPAPAAAGLHLLRPAHAANPLPLFAPSGIRFVFPYKGPHRPLLFRSNPVNAGILLFLPACKTAVPAVFCPLPSLWHTELLLAGLMRLGSQLRFFLPGPAPKSHPVGGSVLPIPVPAAAVPNAPVWHHIHLFALPAVRLPVVLLLPSASARTAFVQPVRSFDMHLYRLLPAAVPVLVFP